MVSSGSIPHLRAHARLGLRQRGADRSRLDAEVPRDLAVIEAEVELRHHHCPLALGEGREEPSDFHPLESSCNLVVAAMASYPLECLEERTRRSPRAAERG